jgi:hypothetical protein
VRPARALLVVGTCAALAACGEPDFAREAGVTAAALRPDSPNTDQLPPVFGPGEKVETLDSQGGSFRVHFSKQGQNKVPAADADGDGVPDYVQLVAAEYDKVGDFYAQQLGFERPPSDVSVPMDNGGDARFDVYLLDFSTSSDGSFSAEQCTSPAATRCPGYMKQENDFIGHNYASLSLATRILASHEYFHAVQAGYDAKAGANINEGTAVWASEQYDASLEDLEGFVAGYLERPDRGLGQEPIGPVDAFSYGSSLFFQFLGERYDRAIVRKLWEALRDDVGAEGPDASWVLALDAVLKDAYDSSIADAFADFSRWNLFTAGRADPERAYENGRMYPELKTKSVTLPFKEEAPRVFPLAAKFYSARASKSGTLTLAVASGASLEGVRLLLAREDGGQLAELAEASAADESSVKLEGVGAGDTIFAAVLNTKTEGDSQRPNVCLGAPSDVEACARKGSSEKSDAGEGEEPEDDAKRESDGGCSVVAGTQPRGIWPAALLLLAAGFTCLRSRRRREENRKLADRSASNESSSSPACRPRCSSCRSGPCRTSSASTRSRT